jgi:RND family efflux transporter MFP subunit
MLAAPAFRRRPGRGSGIPSSPRNHFLGLILLAAVLAVVPIGCRGHAGSGAPPSQPTLVQVEAVHVLPVDDATEYVASVQSLSSTGIKPEVAGDITKILVTSGDRVVPGTPLFVIDPRRQEATVSSQDAARAAQEAAALYAGQQAERAKQLFAVGAISQQELDQARSNDAAAQAQLESLGARLQQERVTLRYYQVEAPAAGIVGDIPVRVGTRVTSDTVLTTIDQNQALEIYVPVPVGRAADLKLGLPLVLFEGENEIARTQVSFISPRVDDQTQSVLVKGRLARGDALRTAQFVRARIVWRTVQAPVIPVLAVTRINGQPFVFVAVEQNGRLLAGQRLVRLGQMVGNDVVVLTGVNAGERVVVSGVQKLTDGSPVRVS